MYKLVRDKIPELIARNSGFTEYPKWRYAEQEEKVFLLDRKLREEVTEFEQAHGEQSRLEELADICEVVDRLVSVYGRAKIDEIRINKGYKNGTFTKFVVLDDMTNGEELDDDFTGSFWHHDKYGFGFVNGTYISKNNLDCVSFHEGYRIFGADLETLYRDFRRVDYLFDINSKWKNKKDENEIIMIISSLSKLGNFLIAPDINSIDRQDDYKSNISFTDLVKEWLPV